MNRYELLLEAEIAPSWYKVTAIKNVRNLSGCIDYCIEKKARLIVTNTAIEIIHAALIRVSKAENVPILVKDKTLAQSLSVAYSHPKIFTKDTLPMVPFIILLDYDGPLPVNTNILTAIYSQKEPGNGTK